MAIFDHLPEEKRYEARLFWERAYDNALAQGLHANPAASEMTASLATQGAATVADMALQHWLERW